MKKIQSCVRPVPDDEPENDERANKPEGRSKSDAPVPHNHSLT